MWQTVRKIAEEILGVKELRPGNRLTYRSEALGSL